MASVSGSDAASADGPVQTLLSKRIRALKKKLNKILQIEKKASESKPLNSEQSDLLKSKPSILSLIDELDKLRLPLSLALADELKDQELKLAHQHRTQLQDLLSLLYFGSMFDVNGNGELAVLRRTHERTCCLTYDYVTEEAGEEMLGERDLDLIAEVGGSVISRPVEGLVSHKEAFKGCVERAELWLRSAEVPIAPDVEVTYAGLRDKLNKIMASDYFTTTPKMKGPVDVAAAVGKFGTTASQMPVPDSELLPPTQANVQNNDTPPQYQQVENEQVDLQATEVSPDESVTADEPLNLDEADEQNPSGEISPGQEEQEKLEGDSENNHRDLEQKETQQHFPRRPYHNQRGGNRVSNGGGRRGFPNGRGGRGGRGGGGGGYQNGRNQQYFDSGYYPRNYYNNRGRGGGRSGASAVYNNNHGAAAATHGGQVELGAS